MFYIAFITKPKQRTGVKLPREVGNGSEQPVKLWVSHLLGELLANTEFMISRVHVYHVSKLLEVDKQLGNRIYTLGA